MFAQINRCLCSFIMFSGICCFNQSITQTNQKRRKWKICVFLMLTFIEFFFIKIGSKMNVLERKSYNPGITEFFVRHRKTYVINKIILELLVKCVKQYLEAIISVQFVVCMIMLIRSSFIAMDVAFAGIHII